MKKREQWGTRTGFVLAAIGSAIGLGNIWRFPYVAYENGGGAFFIPYLFAMLTAGIPFMILEFGVGHKIRGSAPQIFARLSSRWEWVGWWQILVSFIISIYYVAICWFVLFKGVKKGIEKASKIFMPLLFVMILIITARAVTLEGSLEGLNWMFKPDFGALLNFKVWVAAYGQIFFSLSIGFAIIVWLGL